MLGGEDVNHWLVTQGWAVAYRRYSADYLAAEDVAHAAGVGIWSGSFDMPWDYRARRWNEASTIAPNTHRQASGIHERSAPPETTIASWRMRGPSLGHPTLERCARSECIGNPEYSTENRRGGTDVVPGLKGDFVNFL
jgi:hypothetical protein